MAQTFPQEMLTDHIAIVGKTGRGKTSTGKLIVEQVVGEGHRVCILDPAKSDWWGLTSSANGARAGLPFDILGGPHGHVPLHDGAGKAVAEVVANGSLRLSIVDMADFRAGGLQRFFVDFAPTLLRKNRGIVYLVVEEAHLFAPKERTGIGAENMAIHYAKQIATAGRTKGLRVVFLTQRVQALHNALLGSCETLIAHGLTAPADQEPIIRWLRANVKAKELRDEIAESLSSLKKGEAWICCGEIATFERRQFPRIKTYDNTATPSANGAQPDVHTAPVDQEKLRAIIGAAVAEAEANDPAKLKEKIADLQRQLAAKPATVREVVPDQEAVTIAHHRGRAEGFNEARGPLEEIRGHLAAAATKIESMIADRTAPVAEFKHVELRAPLPETRHANIQTKPESERRVNNSHAGVNLSRPQQRILDALAWLESVGIDSADRVRTAMLADQSPRSSGYEKNISTLKTAGHIVYPSVGVVALTDQGRDNANYPGGVLTQADLHWAISNKISGPAWRILQALITAYPKALSREDTARQAGQSPLSSGYEKNVSTLRSLGFLEYPERGHLVASELLFVRQP